MSRHIRVLIADDHPLFREGLRASLASNSETELVGEAEDGMQAIEAALHLKPDVVLMDIQMPVCDGVTATRRILEKEPAIRVLILTMHEDDESVLSVIRAGARGYVVKGDTADAVLRAIVAVAHGEVLIGAGVADRMAALLDGSRGQVPHTAFPDLTDRERERFD